MKKILNIFILIIMVTSCTKREVTISNEEIAKNDSLSLHVAIIPNMDCLPIYYAKKTGIFDSLGVRVILHEFTSQMDVDTALSNNRVHIGYTELTRMLIMERDSSFLDVLAQMSGHQTLVTARTKRIRNIKHLEHKLVSLDRHSTSDYWSDMLISELSMELNSIFRIQCNDIQLRTKLLCDQLLDAAFLPQPYAYYAVQKGNKLLWQMNDSAVSFAVIASQKFDEKDTLRQKQKRIFLDGYNVAIEKLNKGNRDSVASILTNCYALDKAFIDSLPIPKFKEIEGLKEDNKASATLWLKQRGRLK